MPHAWRKDRHSSTTSTSGLWQTKQSQATTSKFLDPPSSPPPTSPLPQLPVLPSPIGSIEARTPPPRPPRPQISLPELRPIRSTSFERPERVYVHNFFPSGQPARLESPFTSPVKVPLRPGPAIRLTDVGPRPGGRYKLDTEGKTTTVHRDSGRIWWSQAVAGSILPASMSLDWPAHDTPPQLPARSKKRRTKNPPQKSVARAALHIPPHLLHDGIVANITASPLSVLPGASTLMQDEPITSLPPWPNGSNDRDESEAQATTRFRNLKDRSEVDRPGLLRISCPDPRIKKLSSISNDSYRHISFRAVTNLEEEHGDSKEAQSAADLRTEIDTVEHAAPVTWHQRHRQLLWVVLTVLVVLILAGGILAGTLWKLGEPHD